YLGAQALPWFIACLFFLGFGGANFSVYTLWLPEQYPTKCRASAFAFATSFARFGGAGVKVLVGMGGGHFGLVGIARALTAIAFLFGLALTPLGVETRGNRCRRRIPRIPLSFLCSCRSRNKYDFRGDQVFDFGCGVAEVGKNFAGGFAEARRRGAHQ